MIVLDAPDNSLLLIRQADHAASSAQMAGGWRRPGVIGASMWPRLVEAVRRHDDGWRAIEQPPPLDQNGRPYDFKSIHTPDHVAVWQASIDAAEDDDLYVALLIALHARWLYTHVNEDHIEQQAAAQAFVHDVTLRIDALIANLAGGGADERAAVRPGPLSAARRLLGFFDALSLSLLGAIDWFDRMGPLDWADQSQTISLTHSDRRAHGGDEADHASKIDVRPWPFAADPVHISTAAVRLGRSRFDEPDQLQHLMDQAAPVLLTWTLGRDDQSAAD